VDFTWTEEEQRLRDDLRAFVAEHVRVDWTLYDRDVPTAQSEREVREHCAVLAERGLLVPNWPVAFGGADASMWEQAVVSEELWGAGEPRGPQYMNVNWIGPAIMLAGTQGQKDLHLGRIARGETLWCQGFSEPGAGSDLGALITRATRDGDEYVINGQKIWTSYAHVADYCYLLARTHPNAPTSSAISIFLVPMDTPGIEVREIRTLGIRHLVHEVFFTDVRVPTSARLGAENEGWGLVRTVLANERIGLARHEHADRALDRLVAESAEAGITPDTPGYLETLGNAAADNAASRVLNYVATDLGFRDSPDRASAASVYRASVAAMEWGVSDAYLDILGPQALNETSWGDYALMFSTTSSIASGALEIQLNNVARHVLRLPKE